MKTKRKRYGSFAAQPFDGELPASKKGTRTIRFPSIDITGEDRLQARFDLKSGRMIAFAVQYEIYIDDGWRPVVRIDASPGEKPHQHDFHPNPRKDSKKPIIKTFGSYAAIFHEAWRSLQRNYQEYRDYYLNAYEHR